MADRPLIRCPPILDEREIELIIDALKSSKGDGPATSREIGLANYLAADLKAEREVRDARERAQAAEEELRRDRAERHVLTTRQAECLAAVRAGQGAAYRPSGAGWRRSRSMGGAVWRMVTALIEEGLLDDKRKLTEAGRRRLEAYEQKRGHVGPIAHKQAV